MSYKDDFSDIAKTMKKWRAEKTLHLQYICNGSFASVRSRFFGAFRFATCLLRHRRKMLLSQKIYYFLGQCFVFSEIIIKFVGN